MSKPLISILTPFKNTEAFLDECLQSILDQTYQNWQLHIIDDHSSDQSYSIVNAYAEKDNRIKLVKNTGNGIIDALRLAYSESRGDYITRMDSDDIMHPEKLELMLTDLQNHGKQHVALGLVKYFGAQGIGDGFSKYESWLNHLTQNGINYSEIYKECVIASPCWMVHREDLVKCGAFERNIYPEDYDLAFRFYRHSIKCIPSNSLLHYWRDYSTRTSRTHEHYAQNHFLPLKIAYFLELEYNANRPLTIWGAGQKGKVTAKLLQEHNIPFYWICDNPKKIGKHIYGELLRSFEYLQHLEQPQSIVTVANTEAQAEITSYFNSQNMKAMMDYFFFC